MGTVTTTPTAKVELTRDAAAVLLKEAREQYENGARELYRCGDEKQRPTIAACTEIIGRMSGVLRPYWWPTSETPVGPQDRPLAEFEFSPATLEWIRWDCGQQRDFVADFDSGMNGGTDPGYHAEQVFLLHVLDGIVRQIDEED